MPKNRRIKSSLKLSHNRHTGRLRPHEATSYLPLVLLLIATGVMLAVGSAYAGTLTGAGSIGLSGTMPGHPPTTAAVITSPTSGSSFSTTPVTVSGTCPAGTLVEIYENDIFAGSTMCSNGHFSLQIGLLLGSNQLVARVFNAVNQEGPKSNVVTVTFAPIVSPGAALSPMDLANQLILNTSTVFRGVFPGNPLNVPITIIGGTPPYALNIEWGDTKNSVVSRNNNITFSEDHTYQKAGTYQITLQATDSMHRVAFLTVAVVVNGQPPIAAAPTKAGPTSGALIDLWPLYAASIAIVVSFWLGERRERHVLAKHPALRLNMQQ